MATGKLEQQVEATSEAIQPKLELPCRADRNFVVLLLEILLGERHVIGRRSSRNTSIGHRSCNDSLASSGAGPSVKNP